MNRRVPMAACLALMKAFDPNNGVPQQVIATAAQGVQAVIGDTAMADVNDGQFAALIDFYIWKGADAFAISAIVNWVQGGNFAKPVEALPTYGARGVAERDVWNVGNSE